MTDKFDFGDIAEGILAEFDQEDSFQQRFMGFCQNAMEGKAEDSDLARLIENVDLDGEDQ